jgi:Stigma-specific protein, Stig1
VSQQTTNRSFDELAKGLATGTLSRGKAIRWMCGALLGAALASLPGVAWANDDCRRLGRECRRDSQCCSGNCVRRGDDRVCACPEGRTRCNDRCVNLQRNENHCGECFNRCEEGQGCEEGVCGGEPMCVSTGGPCSTDSECCSGICDGTCACKATGSTCSADSECCSGDCNSSGTCSACPTDKVELSNGTCATPCGANCDYRPCCGGGCACLRNFCLRPDSPLGDACINDMDCPGGYFCNDIACQATC